MQVSGSVPRIGFITAESDEARKSATVAIPGTLGTRHESNLHMKKLILLILILNTQILFSQNIEKKIQGNWLVVPGRIELGENAENPSSYSGYLLSFDEGKLTIAHINYHNEHAYTYLIENYNIVLSDSTVFEIVSLVPDNFSIRIDNGYKHRLIEIPFRQQNIKGFNPDILTASSWIFSIDEFDYQFRLEFLKSKYELADDATCNLYSRAAKEMDFSYHETLSKWRYFSFQNQPFLSIAFYPHNSVLHQIINFSNDTIFLKSWDHDRFVYPYLYRVESVDNELLEKKESIIKSKNWQTVQIDYPEITSVKFVNERIKKETNAILENSLTFAFVKDSLIVSVNGEIIDNATWNLSEDGKFIRLFDNEKLFGYLEIIKIEPDSLTLRNNFYFSHLMNLNDFDIDFILRLQ